MSTATESIRSHQAAFAPARSLASIPVPPPSPGLTLLERFNHRGAHCEVYRRGQYEYFGFEWRVTVGSLSDTGGGLTQATTRDGAVRQAEVMVENARREQAAAALGQGEPHQCDGGFARRPE